MMLYSAIMKDPEKIFNTTSSVVIIFNGDGAIVWMNSACEQTLGFRLSGLRQTPPWPFFAENDQEKVASMIRQAKGGNPPDALDIPVRCAGKSIIHIRWSTLLTADENNPSQKSIIFLGTRTADAKQKKVDLKTAEEHYRPFFENVGIGMMYVGEDSNIALVNSEFEKLTGYSKAEAEGKKSWMALVADENDLEGMKEYQRLRGNDPALAPTAYNTKVRHKNGDILDVIVHVTMLPETTYRLVSFLDMTKERNAQQVIRKSEEKFTKVFMMTPDCVAITRVADGMIVDVNRGFEEITGWKRSEAIGRTSLEINFWADPVQRNRMVEDLKTDRDVLNREFHFRKNDGSVRYGVFSARLIQIAGEEHLIFVLQDISQRVEMEKTLKINKEHSQAITNNLPGVVFQFYAMDAGEYGISYVSERMSELFGIQADLDDLFPLFVSLVYEEDRSKLMTSILDAVKSVAPWNFEGRFVKPSGEVIWFQGISTPTRRKDRVVFDGIFMDVTTRRNAEEMSRLSEEKFSKIFMLTPEGVSISRIEDGLIIDCNVAFEQMLGRKREETLGLTSLEIPFWDNPADRLWMVNKLQAGRDIRQRECRFRRKDGSVGYGMYSARPISIYGEACIVFLLQDITERQCLEEERRKLEQQLHQSQKMDAIGQLASGVAHDFNNILTAIQGNASLILTDYHSEHPHYQKLNRIEENVMRGAKLTKQLLGFARGGKYEVKTFSVNDLVHKTAQFFLETKKEIEADFQLQEDTFPVDADTGQMEQVLLNIYINAGHAMPEGGSLYIQTGNVTLQETAAHALEIPPGDYVRISISDTGIGMDQQTLIKIFEPFFTTKSAQGGTGLGLASAYGIIRNHGGVIHVDSKPGQGAAFKIYLPASGKKVTQEHQRAPKGLISGSGSILLVDDESMILGVASEMLQILGYTVYPAGSGQEAVSIYAQKNHAIDLVILDMILPGISGAHVLKMIQEINPHVRVILSSGYSMQGEVQKIMESGCLGFIQKPYNFADLSTIVHQTIHSS